MSAKLTTRQINAIRAALGKHSFTPLEVAQLDYHVIRHAQGLGPKSIAGIRQWLLEAGQAVDHWQLDDGHAQRERRRAQRIAQAIALLERYGYTVKPRTND